MAYRRTPLAIGEWYHCYSRGVDKRTTFETENDYLRFLQLLYLANDTRPIERSLFAGDPPDAILSRERVQPIVAIGAYCLMPNHFHILIHEITENGITRFMHKLGTGYTMYFNVRNKRVGNLFVKPFRSRHVDTDAYLYRVTQYIHLNPAEMFEPEWKIGRIKNFRALEEKLQNYKYSSLIDYHETMRRAAKSILDASAYATLSEGLPALKNLLPEAAAYYSEL